MTRLLMLLALLLLVTTPALAQETFTFQGRLTTPEGTPVSDGSHSVRFQLFDHETGGSPRWGEANAVTTDEGVFSVVLGTVNTLNLNVFDETPYLLLIVDNEAMEPRVLLTAVPFAMKSYRLDEQALHAGDNVSIRRRTDGSLEIEATGGGGGTGGLTSVSTDGTMEGDGTSSNPLGLANGSVTGAKLANGALVAGQNVAVIRQGNGAFEVSATGGGGGLTQVESDATLVGEGTTGSPLAVQVPLVLMNPGNGTVLEAHNGTGTLGHLGGSESGAYGESSQGHRGLLGGEYSGVFGLHSSGNIGELGLSNYGAYGFSNTTAGVYGAHNNGTSGYLGGSVFGVYGVHSSSGNSGALGTPSYAGLFNGDVWVTGTLSKGGGSFKIDHPLDPANKYLAHSFVESPDMMNVYNGNVTT
ncbi:MAG TPA: hypothetical protein VKP65_04300, partial [Rhodothermales bacterium]|nr:hypothetical protein [Rhodothermales bacterium]